MKDLLFGNCSDDDAQNISIVSCELWPYLWVCSKTSGGENQASLRYSKKFNSIPIYQQLHLQTKQCISTIVRIHEIEYHGYLVYKNHKIKTWRWNTAIIKNFGERYNIYL